MRLLIILESNSNKKLDALCKEVVLAIKSTGAVKAGPIAYKGKRLIYCYGTNVRTCDRIASIALPTGVNVMIDSLEG